MSRTPTEENPEEPGSGLGKAELDLEWRELLGRVARYCMGSAARESLEALVPELDIEQATLAMQKTAETMALGERGASLPVRALEDPTELFASVGRGFTVAPLALLRFAEVLEMAQELRRFLSEHRDIGPHLAADLATDARLDSLLVTLRAAIEADATISDRASPGLRAARQRADTIRRQLTGRLQDLMARHRDVLRDAYYTERDGRFVLPVRSDAHRRVPGLVLGSSGSGGTLYVEPQETIELCNRLQVEFAEVEREEARVLAELSLAVRLELPAAENAWRACLEADILSSIARWAVVARAHPILPVAEPELRIHGFRHPLLVGTGIEVVPNDIALSAGEALIISGPNAGGKTVLIKGLGLAAWMVRCGLPVTAAPESVVGWFDQVLTDVGDDQSLERSLSTFSAQVVNLRDILGRAGRQSLVLLDELAGGTDPEEGSALAQAVLEALVANGAAVAVTTHYERLKEAAGSSGPLRNASVGFDLQSLTPTFRLELGVPGPSSALAVARSFGVGDAIVERARQLLPEEALRREQLLQELQLERQALRSALEVAECDARRQAELRAELEVERQGVRERERDKLAREGQQLMALVTEARASLRKLTLRLRQEPLDRAELQGLEAEIDRAARPVTLGSSLANAMLRSTPGRTPDPEELRPGTRVCLTRLGRDAEVVAPPARGQLTVLAGSLKLVVPVTDVTLAARRPAKPRVTDRKRGARDSIARARTQSVDGFVPVRTAGNTLDLRGERVGIALDRVDQFLDRMLSAQERAAYILHGHGTGRLKVAVRDHVAKSSYVERSQAADADDGGDAFTVIWLR